MWEFSWIERRWPGPQFVGMWRDVAWHQQLTRAIKSAPIAADLRHGRLYERL